MSTRPISYVKAHLAEVIEEPDLGAPVRITQSGVDTAVLLDVETYERTQRTLVMLKILALSERDVASGRTVDQAEVFRGLRARLATPPKPSSKARKAR